MGGDRHSMKLIHGDCLKHLREIPDNSVDLVLTSPPYNMNLRISNGKHISRQLVKEISTKYDGFDDNLPMDEYFNFNRKVLVELLRVSPLVFYNVQFLTGNKKALYDLIGHFSHKLKEFIVWDKGHGQPAISEGVLNSQWEAILVFENDNAISRRFETAQFDRGTLSNLWRITRGESHPDHGATFPMELAKKIVGSFSSKGDTVLDPFMGTGTTGAACRALDREFIGIELLENYYTYACDRLHTETLL